ncbi:MAG TPA: hypothetical protein VG826_34985 [Pirellulales bacterium]|nr:hypothetical protein [Pirellulales bacterium]
MELLNTNPSTIKTRTKMSDHISFSEFARLRGCRPRDLSDLFYSRDLDETKLVTIRGRRFIPWTYAPRIMEILTARGRIRPELATAVEAGETELGPLQDLKVEE